MMLAMSSEADVQVRAIALDTVEQLDSWLASHISSEADSDWRAHYRFARFNIERMRTDPASIKQLTPVKVPPGSPIGASLNWD